MKPFLALAVMFYTPVNIDPQVTPYFKQPVSFTVEVSDDTFTDSIKCQELAAKVNKARGAKIDGKFVVGGWCKIIVADKGK